MRILKRVVPAMTFAVLVALGGGCGDDGDGDTETESGDRDYPEQIRDNFMTACVAAGSATGDCADALECIEERLTEEEFIELDAAARAGTTSPELDEVMAACI